MPDVQKKKKRRHSIPRKKKQPKPPPQPKKPDIKMLNYGVRVYDLEGRESLQEIINKSKVKAKYNIEARNYTQLIEHFEMPTATNHIAMCADNNHLFACGIYPPQICCFELDQLTLKFKRHVDHEILKVVPLSNDFRKVALLANDRYIELHAQFGHYYKFRIPKVVYCVLY
jgi:ribosome biogenesis protein ENP2